MLLKVLGLICAGVFVAAAVLEVKQITVRRKNRPHDEQRPEERDGQESAPLTNSEDTACQAKHSK